MDSTVRFYVGVLGARLIATIGTPSFRHYFFEIGVGNTVAFFEYQGVELEPFAKPAGLPHPRAVQFDHVSVALVDEEALLELRDRLKRADCEVTDVVDHGFIRSIYFSDPNGIALEASWWTVDPTGHAGLSFDDTRMFDDPTPVAAVRELQSGALQRVPATKLAGGYTVKRDDWVSGERRD
jgi:catechol 2,3-dioxygenase-like lactoylglutathione lyase family enzyme